MKVMNGTSTYLEFDDDAGEVALHMPAGKEGGAMSGIAALLLLALNDEDCQGLLEEVCEIVSEKVNNND